MRRLATALGIVMLGLTAVPAAGQAVHVEVGLNAPPVSARVVLGPPIFTWYGYPVRGVWLTDPYLVRLHREHLIWLAHERARFAAMHRYDRGYWDAVRVYQRERVAREVVLERAYQRRVGDRDRDWYWERRADRHWDRGRHGDRDDRYGDHR